MSWHTLPKDDAWKQVTLAHVEDLGVPIWIHCHCCHQRMVDPRAYAVEVSLPMDTPLLSIAGPAALFSLRRARGSSMGRAVWDQAVRVTPGMDEAITDRCEEATTDDASRCLWGGCARTSGEVSTRGT